MSRHATYTEYQSADAKLDTAIAELEAALDNLTKVRKNNPGGAVIRARAAALTAERQVERYRDDVTALIRSHWIPRRDYPKPSEPEPEVLRRSACVI